MPLFAQICLFLFIALSPIQDFFLQGTPLRMIGASPSFFPLLAIAAFSFARWLSSGDLKINRVLLILILYIVLTSTYGFIFFGVTSHGENLFWKATTSFVSLALFVSAIIGVDYQPRATVRAALYTASVILVLGLCLSSPTPFGLPPLLDNPVFHFTSFSSFLGARPRGLSSETSQLSITVITIGLLCAHVSRSMVAKAFFISSALGLLIASGSKGGISMLLLCLAILCIVKWHSKWYHVPAVILVLVPIGLITTWLIPNLFPEDAFTLSGTVSTRSSMILCSLITVMHHPFGVGLSGFLPAVARYLPSAMDTVQSYSSLPLNFDEVSEYLTSADMVSTKTFLFDQVMRFGVPFAIFFFAFITKMLRQLAAKKQPTLYVAILACSIAVATYIPAIGQYTTAVVFGVALNEVRSGTFTDGRK